MVDISTMILDPGTTAAVSGITAATSAARHRRMLLAYYGGRKDIDLHSSPTNASFHTTSYMNHLRGPPSPLRYTSPTRGGGRGGVGVHIHYQGHCPHGPLSYPENYFRASYSESDAYPYPQPQPHHTLPDAYPYPQPHHTLPDPYNADYTNLSCGCSQCYWRDFLTSDIEKYKTACQQLRETYIWNLRELYYVGRVREIYDNHCRHHRLLFRHVCLTWETPEKVTLREESVGTPLSRRSSGSQRRPISPSSGNPTPLLRGESEGQQSVEARVVSKGKEKEVIPSSDVEVNTPIGSIDDDHDSKGEGRSTGKAKEQLIISLTTPPTTKPYTKSHKNLIQKRFRQLWPIKVHGKSPNKAELAHLVNKDGDRHGGDEQDSMSN
ncbi:hypothetical protein F4803DRAFT_545875 [Xylaria telfairii]|nr:hypothetical protein F4803DRAFT_545875 [Xylaria telfairii]